MKNPLILAKSLYILGKKEEGDKVVSSFLDYIKKRHLEKNLPKIVSHLKNILEKDNKANDINISSAFKLSENEENKLKNIVGSPKDKKVLNIVDSNLLGGGVVGHKGYIYDFSIRNKLDKLKESLINN